MQSWQAFSRKALASVETESSFVGVYKWLIIFFVLSLSACSLQNKPAVFLDLSAHSSYYIDFEKKFDNQSISEVKSKFKSFKGKPISLGYLDAAIWVHIKLNEAQAFSGLLVFESRTDFVTLFAGQILKSGLGIAQSKWPVLHRNPAFKISKEQLTEGVFLKIENKGSIQVRTSLMNDAEFHRITRNETMLFGMYYGLMLIMMVYNFFLFISLRDRTYILYILYLGSLTLLMANANGWSFFYLWPESPRFERYCTSFSALNLLFWAARFTISFLETRRVIPRLHLALQTISVFAAVAMVFIPFISIRLMLQTINYAAFLGNIVLFAAAIAALAKGLRQARFFLLAWSALMLGSMVVVLFYLGLVPNNFFTYYSLQIGGAIEITLLSFALADRMNIIKDENEKVKLESVSTRASLKEIKQELAVAQKIQRSLLPLEVPEIDGADISVRFLPCQEIGGDYYDLQKLDNHQLALLISAVSGHGISAAMISSMVKVSFAQQQRNLRRPARLLNNMNQSLSKLIGQSFLTCFVAYINLRRKYVRLARAGHPAALHWQAESNTINEIKPSGRLIGGFLDNSYREVQINIGSGDKLLFFTDGITEVTNENNEMFGDEQLASFLEQHAYLNATQFSDKLMKKLINWQNNERTFEDDIALILISFN